MSESIFNLPLLIEARRLRLDAMRVRLPGPLWFVIVAGALISLCSTFFFRVDDPRLHRIAAAATRVWGPEHQ